MKITHGSTYIHIMPNTIKNYKDRYFFFMVMFTKNNKDKYFFCIDIFTLLVGLYKVKWMQTLLLCAGGQSSSLTPNVTPGDCFFSNGFLISPGIPFLHVPLSLGGLVSSSGWHNYCYLPKIQHARFHATDKGIHFCFYLCACFSSPAPVWVSADWVLWSLLFLPEVCVWCSVTGAMVLVMALSCCL